MKLIEKLLAAVKATTTNHIGETEWKLDVAPTLRRLFAKTLKEHGSSAQQAKAGKARWADVSADDRNEKMRALVAKRWSK